MAKPVSPNQLAIGAAALVVAVDRPRNMLAAKPASAPKVAKAIQFDLVPIRRRSKKDVDPETRLRQLAGDIAEYLAEYPEMRKSIRSKRKKVSVPRVGRDGDRPESLGTGELTEEERNEMEQDVLILDALGVKLGPPPRLADCPKSGPCGRVSCRHHNYLEVDGEFIKLNFPHLEPQDLKHPCSLRVADRAAKRKPIGPNGEVLSHAEASKFVGLTAERTRQIEAGALKQIKRERSDLNEH